MKKTLWLGALLCAVLSMMAYAGVETTGGGTGMISKNTLFDTFESGGWVMWPILLCSMTALAYAVERFFNLRLAAVLPESLQQTYREVMQRISKGERQPALLRQLVTDNPAEGAQLFRKYLGREFKDARSSEQVLQEYVEVTKWHLQKNIKPLALMANVSPLLGLFGTVLGMIQCFDTVAEKGLGRPELLASGMAVALLTTAFGLVVAIPATFAYHHLQEKSTKTTFALYGMLHNLTIAWLNEERQGIDIET